MGVFEATAELVAVCRRMQRMLGELGETDWARWVEEFCDDLLEADSLEQQAEIAALLAVGCEAAGSLGGVVIEGDAAASLDLQITRSHLESLAHTVARAREL